MITAPKSSSSMVTSGNGTITTEMSESDDYKFEFSYYLNYYEGYNGATLTNISNPFTGFMLAIIPMVFRFSETESSLLYKPSVEK